VRLVGGVAIGVGLDALDRRVGTSASAAAVTFEAVSPVRTVSSDRCGSAPECVGALPLLFVVVLPLVLPT
jgi:hypothetical protein